MNVKLLDGKIIKNVKIKKASTRLNRAFGYTKMSHWIDEATGASCTVPVVKESKMYFEKV